MKTDIVLILWVLSTTWKNESLIQISKKYLCENGTLSEKDIDFLHFNFISKLNSFNFLAKLHFHFFLLVLVLQSKQILVIEQGSILFQAPLTELLTTFWH